MKITDPGEAFFANYVAERKIVVADTSSISRTSLANLLVSMGAKTTNIALAMDYRHAEEEIERMKPDIVICDYDLGRKCGLDLLQRQRFHHPESKDSLFILVTGNTSQSAVAKAAEEDIDGYVIKPFSPGALRGSILRAALAKLKPTEYVKTIERGKQEIAEGRFDEAVRAFEYATTLDPAPSLACFYLGQAKLIKQLMDEAQGSYAQGLEFNKIHYKCMVGLYEVLMARKRHAEAYDVIKRISHYFPANPQRLTAVLRLAILTQSYEDVERYYRVFTSIDERDEQMIKYICAALVVCGKYYLQKNFGSRALELFQKAAATASGRTRVLREIIVSLVESGLAKEASEYLKKFPADTQGGADYLVMKLLVADQLKGRGVAIDQGRSLIERGVHDPLAYRLLIVRSIEAGLRSAAEGLVQDAAERWPEQKEQFESLLPDPARKASGTE